MNRKLAKKIYTLYVDHVIAAEKEMITSSEDVESVYAEIERVRETALADFDKLGDIETITIGEDVKIIMKDGNIYR